MSAWKRINKSDISARWKRREIDREHAKMFAKVYDKIAINGFSEILATNNYFFSHYTTDGKVIKKKHKKLLA